MADAELEARVEELEARVDELEQLVVPDNQPTTPSNDRDIERWGQDLLDATEEYLEEEETATARVIDVIREFERAYGEAREIDAVVEEVVDDGFSEDEARDAINKLRREGAIYEPQSGCLKVV